MRTHKHARMHVCTHTCTHAHTHTYTDVTNLHFWGISCCSQQQLWSWGYRIHHHSHNSLQELHEVEPCWLTGIFQLASAHYRFLCRNDGHTHHSTPSSLLHTANHLQRCTCPENNMKFVSLWHSVMAKNFSLVKSHGWWLWKTKQTKKQVANNLHCMLLVFVFPSLPLCCCCCCCAFFLVFVWHNHFRYC